MACPKIGESEGKLFHNVTSYSKYTIPQHDTPVCMKYTQSTCNYSPDEKTLECPTGTIKTDLNIFNPPSPSIKDTVCISLISNKIDMKMRTNKSCNFRL